MPENTIKVITNKIRLSYVRVFEPRVDDKGKAKYSCLLLIPKSDKAVMSKLRAAQREAINQGNQGKFNGKKLNPEKLGTGQGWDTIHDGDESDVEDNAGCWLLNVSSGTKPGVVDRNLDPIMDSAELYSGCYARVSLNCYPYNYEGKIGITFGLNHVQKLQDGESLSGRTKAEDDFDALPDDEFEDSVL